MQELNYEKTTKSLDEIMRRIQRSYVKDTTKGRAPVYYLAPDFTSADPQKDFEEGMRIIGSIDLNDCFLYFEDWPKGKRLLLKAAHNGHAKAQFVLGCMYKIGINYCPDFTMAEIWLQEAIQNGLGGEDLVKAKSELYDVQQQRRARWMRVCFNEEEI